jgi:integrase/recombinase XerD
LFIANLPAAGPFVETLTIDRSWKKRRDRAMLAMMIGAGLKVSEVVAIETESVGTVDTTGSVPINIRSWESDGTSRPHRAMLRPFATKEVLAWRDERKFLKIPGKLLFPSALKPKKSKTNQINKATVYRIVKETFVLAGIDVARMGGRTLRNTFAIHELETQPAELVGEFLGHRKMRSTEHYMPYTKRASNKAKLKQREK